MVGLYLKLQPPRQLTMLNTLSNLINKKENRINGKDLREACGSFATGVTVISTKHKNHEHGMTANAFMSISLDPALIAISISKNAKMLDLIKKAGRFAVSILPEGQTTTAMHFAGKPNDEITKPFIEIDGLPVIDGAMTYFTTNTYKKVDAGDHVIFIGEVKEMNTDPSKSPLIFHNGKFL